LAAPRIRASVTSGWLRDAVFVAMVSPYRLVSRSQRA
jgi:hypothetical protein